MYNRSRRFGRKVRPVTRHGGTDDPLKLVANVELGNAEWMLESMAHEFAGLGYDADELTNLFRCPAHPALNQLLDYFGPAEIRRRIDFLLTRSRAQDIGPKGMLARGDKDDTSSQVVPPRPDAACRPSTDPDGLASDGGKRLHRQLELSTQLHRQKARHL